MMRAILLAGAVALGAASASAGTQVLDKREMPFEACKLAVVQAINNIGAGAQTALIADNSFVFMVKIYADEGEILITCSEPDRKMLITLTN